MTPDERHEAELARIQERFARKAIRREQKRVERRNKGFWRYWFGAFWPW